MSTASLGSILKGQRTSGGRPSLHVSVMHIMLMSEAAAAVHQLLLMPSPLPLGCGASLRKPADTIPIGLLFLHLCHILKTNKTLCAAVPCCRTRPSAWLSHRRLIRGRRSRGWCIHTWRSRGWRSHLLHCPRPSLSSKGCRWAERKATASQAPCRDTTQQTKTELADAVTKRGAL